MLLGFFANAKAQNPIANIIEITKTDGTIITDKVIDDKYAYTFVGKPGAVSYKKYNGEVVTDEENTDLYAIVDKFVDYDKPFEVRLIANDVLFEDKNRVGLIISRSHINELSEDPDYHSQERAFDSYFGENVNHVIVHSANYEGCIFDDNKTLGIMLYKSNNSNSKFQFSLDTPKYLSTYYFRPYVKFADGQVMYGGEKQFVTTDTKLGYLTNHELYGSFEGNYLVKEALTSFIDAHPELAKVKDSEYYMQVLGKYIMKDCEQIEGGLTFSDVTTHECVDSELYLVNSIPSTLSSHFWERTQDTVFVSLDNIAKEYDNEMTLRFNNYSSCEKESFKLDNYSNTDGESSVSYHFITDNKIPASVGFYVSDYIKPVEYDIYVEIFNANLEESGPSYIPSRIGATIYEKTNAKFYPSMGTNMKNGSKISFESNEEPVQKIHLGKRKFNGGEVLIELSNKSTSIMVKDKGHSRDLRITKLYLVPSTND